MFRAFFELEVTIPLSSWAARPAPPTFLLLGRKMGAGTTHEPAHRYLRPSNQDHTCRTAQPFARPHDRSKVRHRTGRSAPIDPCLSRSTMKGGTIFRGVRFLIVRERWYKNYFPSFVLSFNIAFCGSLAQCCLNLGQFRLKRRSSMFHWWQEKIRYRDPVHLMCSAEDVCTIAIPKEHENNRPVRLPASTASLEIRETLTSGPRISLQLF